MAYSKYFLYKKQLSYDGGQTWVDTDPLETTTSGDPIATYDTLEECETSKFYLTIIPENNGYLSLAYARGTFQYSLDSGNTWGSANADTVITVSANDKVMFKGSLYPETDFGIGMFSASTNYEAEGNPMSLIYGDDFEEQTRVPAYAFTSLFNHIERAGSGYLIGINNLVLPATTLAKSCYQHMFDGSLITSIPSGFLPATTLADYCYSGMFYECSNLTSIPSDLLPATTLLNGCYSNMFQSCTSLTTLPENLLPATTLVYGCYHQMFDDCTSLTSIPENLLPATTMIDFCYQGMFASCTSLTTLPENLLPATTLALCCYSHMFGNSTSLTTPPKLPAATLTKQCYEYMFYGCTSLNKIICLAQSGIGTNYSTDYWVSGVASSGTFYKSSNANWETGINGIPSGWAVQDV